MEGGHQVLHELISQLDLTQILLFTVTTVGGALLVWYRKRLAEWKTFWSGVLDGLRGIPELRADVQGIRYYVAPNGGGSLMDSVRRTEAAVGALTEQVDLMSQTMWAENDSDDEIGRFHCNATGENTYVNQLYARWLGVGKSELMGWGYFNFIHSNDIDRVRRHWELCRSEHRRYRIRHHMVAANGETIEVEVIAIPIPESGPAKRWVGSIRRIDNGRRQPDPSKP
jgi:PAS domain S-box-containing protein